MTHVKVVARVVRRFVESFCDLAIPWLYVLTVFLLAGVGRIGWWTAGFFILYTFFLRVPIKRS